MAKQLAQSHTTFAEPVFEPKQSASATHTTNCLLTVDETNDGASVCTHG